MHHLYSLYGLVVSSDRQLAHLAPLSPPYRPVDLHLVFMQPAPDPLLHLSPDDWQQHPHYSIATADNPDAPDSTLRILTDPALSYFRLRYPEGMTYTMPPDGRAIYVAFPDTMKLERVVSHLLNQVMTFCMRLQGRVSLHASAVGTPDGAILFVAPSGSGKSTIAFSFARRGFPVFADDVCTLMDAPDGQVAVAASHPALRLWDGNARDLLSAQIVESLPPLPSADSKRIVDVRELRYQFADAPLAVRAVCFLDGYADAVRIQSVSPAQALMRLMRNTYVTYSHATEKRAGDFHWLTRLTTQAAALSLVRPQDISQLDRSTEAVLYHLDHLLPAAQPSGL